MNARSYFSRLQRAINGAPHVISSDLSFNEVDVNECYIRGKLTLRGGIQLHIAEYVVTELDASRLKYRYHLQQRDGTLIVRWDNAPHHPGVPTHPDHRHEADGSVYASAAMDVPQVLLLVVPYLQV